MRRVLKSLAALFLMTGIVSACGVLIHEDQLQAFETGPNRIVLVFAGDVMLSNDVAVFINSVGKGDYTFPWWNIAGYFSKADIAFINLESPVTDKGTLNTLKSGPWFRADPKAMTGLKYAGIDVISVANNHAFDYGRTGFEDFLSRLRAAGIPYVGGGLTWSEAYSPKYFTVKGKKIAVLAFLKTVYYPCYNWRATKPSTLSKGTSGIAWMMEADLKNGIAQAKANNADLIVVSMHFGQEYETVQSSVQESFAKLAIDLGADIVVGHHPHIIQASGVYSKGYISYSLGNLIFDLNESFHPGSTRGEVLEVVWDLGKPPVACERFIRINEATAQPSFE